MKIRAYTLDSSKLLKRGAPEYDPHQEQAKTDVTLNGHIGQECYVEIMDEELRKELFSMCNIANVTMPSEEIAEATWEEAKSYYQADCRYRYRGENFVLLVLEEVGDGYDPPMAIFKSERDGHILYIPAKHMGTFLPDVANDEAVIELI